MLLFFTTFLSFASSVSAPLWEYLFYSDRDHNGKIDTLEIIFNQNLTFSGTLNLDQFKLSSSTGWLSTSALKDISGNTIIKDLSLSGNTVLIQIFEQDLYNTWLFISDGTTGQLRVKTNTNIWIVWESGLHINLSLTTSFSNYKNVAYKTYDLSNPEQQEVDEDWGDDDIIQEETTPEESEDGVIEDEEPILDESWDDHQDEVDEGSWSTVPIDPFELDLWEEENPQTPTLGFSVKLAFQSPTYLLQKENPLSNLFSCDTSQKECRVNYQLLVDEGSGEKSLSSQYVCAWDFGIGALTWEEGKCNPNTLLYPVGNFKTSFWVYQKSNSGAVYRREFLVQNTGYVPPVVSSSSSSNTSNTQNTSPINILTPQIVVQSGLDEEKHCKNIDCKVNLLYTTLNSKEMCEWDFWGWVFVPWDEKKCNPPSVSYGTGTFEITLKVFEQQRSENFALSKMTFLNLPLEKESNEVKKETKKTPLPELPKLSWEEVRETYQLTLRKVLPNPAYPEELEYIEIENRGKSDLSLWWCQLDDDEHGGSKPYDFSQTEVIPAHSSKKFYRFDTKISLNNSWYEEVNVTCLWEKIDMISWNFSLPDDFYLSKDLDLEHIQKVKRLEKYTFELTMSSGEKQVIIQKEDSTLLKDIVEKSGSKEEKQAWVKDVLQKTFSQKILLQDDTIFIIGNTLPGIKLMIELVEKDETIWWIPRSFAWESYSVVADEYGDYSLEFPVKDLDEYDIKTTTLLWDQVFTFAMNQTIETVSSTIEKKQTSSNQWAITIAPQALITLQWKLSQQKELIGKKIICKEVDTCSVNFDGSNSVGKNLTYFWDFWNGQTFEKKNPASYTFWVGTYLITLLVSDGVTSSTDSFIVQVTGKPEKTVTPNSTKQPPIAWEKTSQMSENIFVNSSNKSTIIFHIWMSMGVFLTFLWGSFILLRKRNII